MNIDEKELLAKICEKDNDAYRHLVKDTYKQLFHAAYKILFDAQLAADAVQDTYTQLLIHGETIKVSLYSWLQTSVRNISLNMLKKRKRGTDMDDENLEFNINRVNCEEYKDSSRGIHVHDCLMKLPEDERYVLLRVNDGLNLTEISRETGIKYAVVRRLYLKAKEDFIKFYEK